MEVQAPGKDATWVTLVRRCWRHYISQLTWECQKIPQEELGQIGGKKGSSCSGCPVAAETLTWINCKKRDGWMDEYFIMSVWC